MSPTLNSIARAFVSFPRVSGDEPISQIHALRSTWFSPRERG